MANDLHEKPDALVVQSLFWHIYRNLHIWERETFVGSYGHLLRLYYSEIQFRKRTVPAPCDGVTCMSRCVDVEAVVGSVRTTTVRTTMRLLQRLKSHTLYCPLFQFILYTFPVVYMACKFMRSFARGSAASFLSFCHDYEFMAGF